MPWAGNQNRNNKKKKRINRLDGYVLCFIPDIRPWENPIKTQSHESPRSMNLFAFDYHIHTYTHTILSLYTFIVHRSYRIWKDWHYVFTIYNRVIIITYDAQYSIGRTIMTGSISVTRNAITMQPVMTRSVQTLPMRQ